MTLPVRLRAVALGLFLCVGCGAPPATDAGPDAGGAFEGGRDAGGAPRDAGAPPMDAGPVDVCGDGVRTPAEACDDGNTDGGDGCSAACDAVEDGFACIRENEPCVRFVTCGNARIEGDETCDDRNTTAGDGCDASCRREPGWACPVVGRACVAARCGDGFVAGFELCDDGGRCNGGASTACTNDNDCVAAGDGDTCAPDPGDGCSERCQLEEGFVCASPGAPCTTTTCGDAVREGTEECDDGNPQIGDGCTPYCTREPDCTDGDCVAVCGDEVIFAPETCDDGNTQSGDGCSSDCQIETGYACTEVPLEDPDSVELPIVVRDFIPGCGPNLRATEGGGGTAPFGHPDFQCYSAAETGLVQSTLVAGLPVRNAPTGVLTSDVDFDRWYRSDDDHNRTVVQRMTLTSSGAGTYQFDSSSFFPLSSPIDGSAPAGFPTEGFETLEDDDNGTGLQNFYFTSEVRFWFEYEGTETLQFSGDDDVWVFVNGRLAVDLGGVHGRETSSITLSHCASSDPGMNMGSCLSPLDLRVGGIYEAVVFQAERRTVQSQYQLTLSNFDRAPSVCRSDCGDGVLANNEACDDGDGNGALYDGCSELCELTPYCGDGVVQTEHGEICDDGLNLGGGPSDCAPGCMEVGARCGDAVVQTEVGEECDDGNTDSGDGCSAECRFELR